MFKTSMIRLALTVGSILSVATSAVATVVVFDGFDDGTRTRTPSGIDWFTYSHAATPTFSVVDDTAGLGSGNALFVDPITSSQAIMGVFGTPVALPQEVGSTLTLRFEMRNETNLPQVPRTVRFGLYDANEATFPDPAGFGGIDADWDQSQPGAYFDPGVFVQQDNSLALTCCPPSATRLREEPNSIFFPDFGTFGNLAFGGGEERNVAQPAGSFPGMAQPEGKNIFTLELKRVAAGSETYAWDVTYTLDNGTGPVSLSGPHLGPEFFGSSITNTGTYDYFALLYEGTFSGEFGDGYADFLIDNFSIDVSSPSPSLQGDYNKDGKVDSADYVIWRNDPTANGGDPGGYNTWRTNYGAMAMGAGTSVPEPSVVWFLTIGIGAVLSWRHRWDI